MLLLKLLDLHLIRFGLCATAATLTHWALMAVLVLLAFNPNLATALGALLGAVVNYVLQYHLAFKCSTSHRETFIRYLLSCAVGWMANLVLFSLLLYLWPHQVLLDQLVTTLLVAGLNYSLYRRMVFNDRVSPHFAN